MRHRFHALCPYFAMFPESFAEMWIERLTRPGDLVLDPFCGRGTAPFQALLMERKAAANDINPVAYCVSRAKLGAPTEASVLRRLTRLQADFEPRRWEPRRRAMAPFFTTAFHRATLRQLLFLREQLQWRTSRVDAMVASLALGALHGESQTSERYFSNQMPRTISTKPEYSLRYWARHNLTAPDRDVFGLLRTHTRFRYETPPPKGDAVVSNLDMRQLTQARFRSPVRCVVTSPPYLNVTDFGEDQWLRLWFLGGEPSPTRGVISRDDRHRSTERYWRLITDMWRMLARVVDPGGHVVVRLGARDDDPERLLRTLVGASQIVPGKVHLIDHAVSEISRRQTGAFRPGSKGCRFEVDAVFRLA
jgi:hypothetical protein